MNDTTVKSLTEIDFEIKKYYEQLNINLKAVVKIFNFLLSRREKIITKLDNVLIKAQSIMGTAMTNHMVYPDLPESFIEYFNISRNPSMKFSSQVQNINLPKNINISKLVTVLTDFENYVTELQTNAETAIDKITADINNYLSQEAASAAVLRQKILSYQSLINNL